MVKCNDTSFAVVMRLAKHVRTVHANAELYDSRADRSKAGSNNRLLQYLGYGMGKCYLVLSDLVRGSGHA